MLWRPWLNYYDPCTCMTGDKGDDASALSAHSPRRDSYFVTKCWKSFMERNNHTELHQHFSLENIPLMVALSKFYMLLIVPFSCTLNIPQDNVCNNCFILIHICLSLFVCRRNTNKKIYSMRSCPQGTQQEACAEQCADIQSCLLVMSTNLFCPLCFRGKLLILTANLMKKKSYFFMSWRQDSSGMQILNYYIQL